MQQTNIPSCGSRVMTNLLRTSWVRNTFFLYLGSYPVRRQHNLVPYDSKSHCEVKAG